MFDRIEDTIVAVSSPPGTGVRGIVRLSGAQSLAMASTVFTPREGDNLLDAGGHQRRMGTVRLDDRAALPAEAYVFRAPASYTRQDLVELHVPGSPPVLAILLDRLMTAGARMAEAGEFTGRAFLAGAIDLTQVEGVAAMIHAQTDAQLRASEALLHGALSRQVHAMREELADLLALIEAEIDFAEEPIEFVSRGQTVQTVERVVSRISHLLATSPSAERLQTLPHVVLTGLANAGKSTLFNRLAGLDRAIQSATAGTTRDAITAPLRLPSGEVMLSDTAGVFAPSTECDDPLLMNEVAQATRRAMATADLILLVVDAASDVDHAIAIMGDRLAGRQFKIVLNKIDALPDGADALVDRLTAHHLLAAVSARTAANIDGLIRAIDELLFRDTTQHGTALLSLSNRQRIAMRSACDALARAGDLLDCDECESVPSELLALEIRHAMHELSLLSGDVTTEDLLGRVFQRFCIGK
jgi:tRNA modification GTPase